MTTSRYSWADALESPHIVALKESLRPDRDALLAHPIYQTLETIEDLAVFINHHVFAVWDFMTLLKALQRRFTTVTIPWTPRANGLACRLVNEIVLVEESDEIGNEYMSHFELYLRGMTEIGADARLIRTFVALIDEGLPVADALAEVDAPPPAAEFVKTTMDLANHAPDHAVAAAFALSREDVIPDMFIRILTSRGPEEGRPATLLEYLNRHITIDGEEHTPMALALVMELCGDDPAKWAECESVARRCLQARDLLWSGVRDAIELERGQPRLRASA
jgi:hypothetical protein